MGQTHRSLKTFAAALAAALVLSACRAPPPPRAPPPSPAPRPYAEPQDSAPLPGAPHAAQPPRENHLSPATRSLVTQARTAMAHGDLDGASATLDRALRIEPGNPLLWVERGKLRLAENDAHQAEGCARKALSLAGGDRAAQAQAGRVLMDALRAEGRNQEAADIAAQPYMR